MEKKGILFVCIGNSCRSIMAEALARHHWNDSLDVFSAGVHPLGLVTPYTLQALRESHIPTGGLYSKGLSAVDYTRFGVVVDLAGFPAWELAPPSFEGKIIRSYVTDPYGGTLDDFREALNAIDSMLRQNIEGWLG
jgi:protein-tyrosine-phosphatase